MSILKTANVSKIFSQGAKDLNILEDVNLTVEKGEVLAITGMSGVGKSTLLHILGALDRPSRGQVFLNEAEVFARPDKELAAFRNQFIGFVFQFHHLLPEFSALENVMLPQLINCRPWEAAKVKATAILAEVGLGERLTHRPGKLSGGEQQRVAIARALVNEPALLLADEPTGNLDEETAAKVLELFWQLNQERKITLVIVTHNEAIAKAANRCYHIHERQVHLVS